MVYHYVYLIIILLFIISQYQKITKSLNMYDIPFDTLSDIMSFVGIFGQIDFLNSITPQFAVTHPIIASYKTIYKKLFVDLIKICVIFAQRCKNIEVCGGVARDGILCILPHDIDIFLLDNCYITTNEGIDMLIHDLCECNYIVVSNKYDKLYGNPRHVQLIVSHKKFPMLLFQIEFTALSNLMPRSDFDINCLVLNYGHYTDTDTVTDTDTDTNTDTDKNKNKNKLFPTLSKNFMYCDNTRKILDSHSEIQKEIVKLLIKSIKNKQCMALYRSYDDVVIINNQRNIINPFSEFVENNQKRRETKILSKGFAILDTKSQEHFYSKIINKLYADITHIKNTIKFLKFINDGKYFMPENLACELKQEMSKFMFS